ncbi:MAG: tyrosinase family protein [Deinococcales bacterium]
MDIRKSALELSNQERHDFLKALIMLKNTEAFVGADYSLYDQFVALHLAVMEVSYPENQESINGGHWNIGFCPWHREYLRRFELALQQMVPGVTLPYWDWAKNRAIMKELFHDDFMGKLTHAQQLSGRRWWPKDLDSGFFRHSMPLSEAPDWWPEQALGWRIPRPLQSVRYPSSYPNAGRLNATLHRGFLEGLSWPPDEADLDELVHLHVSGTGYHHFWYFWYRLEQGSNMHNTAHNLIGGHMSTGASPNDPIFWLHHANVDRLKLLWQSHQIKDHGGNLINHYPQQGDLAPWSDKPAPRGHYLDDLMCLG